MKLTICPRCDNHMYDDPDGIRFKCNKCGYYFDCTDELFEALTENLIDVFTKENRKYNEKRESD